MKNLDNRPCYVTLEVQNNTCKVSRMLEGVVNGNQHHEILDIRSTPEGKVRHLVKMERAKTKARNGVNGNGKGNGNGFGDNGLDAGRTQWYECEGCNICKTILRYNSFLVSRTSVGDNSVFLYSFMATNFGTFKHIFAEMEGLGLAPKIMRVEDYAFRSKVLTEKQERALWLGLQTGFFDYPRRTNTQALAKSLGIKASTLSEITRRGMHRLLEVFFETNLVSG